MELSKDITYGSKTPLLSYKTVWWVVLIVALLQACYAVGFIARTSFVVEGRRYYCLFDDAMISMRYAANWAQGHGFVWNVGERVEGCTNFLWTAIIGICHLLPLSPSHMCLLVQVLGIPVLWSCLVGTVLLAKSCRLSQFSASCAVVFAGSFYNLMFFTLFGMETGLLTALVTFALAAAVKSIRQKNASLMPMLWFAPAALVRLDVLPVTLFVFATVFIWVKKGRFRLVMGLLIVTAVVMTHFLWRHHFYGEWLPNTYYLKATGWPLYERLGAGIRQTLWSTLTFGFPVIFAAILLINPKRWHFLLLGCFAFGVAYQVYIGGDAWPLNRFLLPASLGLFVLAAEGLYKSALFIKRTTGLSEKFVSTALAALVVIAVNWIHWDHYLFIARPQTTGENRLNIRYALGLEKAAEPDMSVAVLWGGTFPYFSKRICCDLLGKCDYHIARIPAHPNIQRAGHNKYDLTYSLNTHKPDIVIHVVDAMNPAFYNNYWPFIVEIDGTEVSFCVRKNLYNKIRKAKTISWDQIIKRLQQMETDMRQDF